MQFSFLHSRLIILYSYYSKFCWSEKTELWTTLITSHLPQLWPYFSLASNVIKEDCPPSTLRELLERRNPEQVFIEVSATGLPVSVLKETVLINCYLTPPSLLTTISLLKRKYFLIRTKFWYLVALSFLLSLTYK